MATMRITDLLFLMLSSSPEPGRAQKEVFLPLFRGNYLGESLLRSARLSSVYKAEHVLYTCSQCTCSLHYIEKSQACSTGHSWRWFTSTNIKPPVGGGNINWTLYLRSQSRYEMLEYLTVIESIGRTVCLKHRTPRSGAIWVRQVVLEGEKLQRRN